MNLDALRSAAQAQNYQVPGTTPVMPGDNPSTLYYNEANNLVTPSNGKNGATDTYAAISRAQWEDYKARYLPKQSELLNMAFNKDAQDAEIAKNVDSANQAAESAQGQTSRNLSRYGANLTPDQVAAQNDRNALNAVGTKVDTINRTRDTVTNRSMNILAGSGEFNSDQRKQVQQQ